MELGTENTAYLLELFQRTKGDARARVSMYDVGAALGMEKGAAGKSAEELIAAGWVEIKSLSGGIGITAEGVAAAQAAGAVPETGSSDPVLEARAVLSASGRPSVEEILTAVRKELPGLAEAALLEEIILDIKTLEVQLLSPRPKTAILRSGLDSIQAALKAAGATALSSRIQRFIGL